MLVLLSPSKNMDLASPAPMKLYTQPELIADAAKLVGHMKRLKPTDLQQLMEINEELAALNHKRFNEWSLPFTEFNAKQAMAAFTGDVYQSMEVSDYTTAQVDFAQRTLRILSGLYGVLRPLDLVQAYRLEMGRKIDYGAHPDLYSFWGEKITKRLQEELDDYGHKVVINLASKEYSKAVKFKQLKVPTIEMAFKEEKNGKLRVLGLFAKRARGHMANFIVRNKVKKVEDLKAFDTDGYTYNETQSTEHTWVFSRPQPPPVS